MRKWLIASLALALLTWPLSLLAQTREKPSISARFETPRDFGYHIGDLVPLTLLIEADAGVVIDLEGLPHRGEAVGPFEVRNVWTDDFRTASGSAYRIEFALQSFVPATDTVAVVFPPLELRFALPEERSADGRYAYRTGTLPPHEFFLSPTAVVPGALRPLNGSVVPPIGWLFWSSVSLGAVFLVLGLAVPASDVVRWWKERSAEKHSEAGRRAMHMLEVLHERYLTCEEKTPELFLKGSDVLRGFLAEECGIPAPAQTIHQILERFRGHPLEKEVEEILERCNKVIYDGQHPTPSERGEIIRELAALISQLEQVGCPTHGENGAAR